MNINLDSRIRALRTLLYPSRKSPSSPILQISKSTVAEVCSRLVWRITCRAVSPYRHIPPEPFPAELWVCIIKEYSRHREWLALGKTCWFFHQVSQACLYEKVSLNRYQKPSRIPVGLSLSLFERSLKRRPELGTLVHDLSLRDQDETGRRSKYRLLSNLDKLPNLKKIRVEFFHVDTDFIYTLHSHPHLSVVEFAHCSFDTLMTPRCSRSSISDVKMISCDNISLGEGTWGAFAPIDGLRTLEVLPVHFFPSKMNAFLSNIMTSGKNHMLEKLSINFLPPSINEFLISSPRLRHLILNFPIDYNDLLNLSSLPADAIPLLEHYSGPVGLSEILLRNRPVHTVGLTFLGDPAYIDILTPLQLSSVPITKMELRTTPEGLWLRHVPITVRHLTFPLKKEAFIKCLPTLLHLTNLRTICGTKCQPGEQLNREEIMQVSKACPSLREFDIPGHERWLMMKPNVWDFEKETTTDAWELYDTWKLGCCR